MIIYRVAFMNTEARRHRVLIYHLAIYNLRFCTLYLVNGLMNCHVELVETSHVVLREYYVRPP